MGIRIASSAIAAVVALGAAVAPTAAFASAPVAHPVLTRAAVSSVTLGLTGKQTLTVSLTATDASGIKSIKSAPYPAAFAAQGAPTASEVAASDAMKVTSATRTSATVGLSQVLDATKDRLPNALAGTWDVAVLVTAKDGSTTFVAKATTFDFKRADTLTSKASATSVKKGAALTVTGRLDRVNWDLATWQGSARQSVQVQFRKAGATAWVTEAWTTSAASGSLRATVKDNASGTWRLLYAGSADSGAAASAGTWVAVK
jgi:Family of unknown function (DUF5707)